jgi:hypothetical protein
MRLSAAALPLVLAALASGCAGSASSTNDFSGEEKQVADVVEQLQSAGESGDAQEICSEILAPSLSERMKAPGSSCEQELDKALKDADDFDLDVEDVTVQGNTATARVKGRVGDGDRVRTLEFERERSGWRATSLGS